LLKLPVIPNGVRDLTVEARITQVNECDRFG